MAGGFLERILAEKAVEVARRRLDVPEASLRARCEHAPPALAVLQALRGDSLAVIAEVKRGSPSKGVFDAGLDAPSFAVACADAGAAMISVLTDGPSFGGSLEDLCAARARLAVPLLRKDFVVDQYQLLEARANGADAVLLIVAALEYPLLKTLFDAALSLGLTPLVEINNAEEALLARRLEAPLVGINNRDLRTFDVDLSTTPRLRPLLDRATVVAALSGIASAAEARLMREAGADAVLVGEALVRAGDPGDLIDAMRRIG